MVSIYLSCFGTTAESDENTRGKVFQRFGQNVIVKTNRVDVESTRCQKGHSLHTLRLVTRFVQTGTRRIPNYDDFPFAVYAYRTLSGAMASCRRTEQLEQRARWRSPPMPPG